MAPKLIKRRLEYARKYFLVLGPKKFGFFTQISRKHSVK
jgi:hypothetical protein